jgi:peptidoglycan hydrolase-like protein with peptidoglycan-binding domain
MKKVIKLKESDLRNLVKQVINEARGDSNIIAIQTALKAAGEPYASLLGKTGQNGDGIDGVYGTNTKNAIIAFQKANGIKPTGFVGTVTAPKLGVEPMKGKGSGGALNKTTGGKLDPHLFDKFGQASSDETRVSRSVGGKLSDNGLTTKGDTTLSSSIKPEWKQLIPVNKISTTKSTPIMKAGQKECARFVHDFTTRLNYVGNAWDAHDIDRVGKRTWSAFTGLNLNTVKKIESEWLKINQNGGGQENGQYNGEVKKLVNSLIPATPPVKLQLDNVVGIFYPPSGHHEEAFYKAGKAYFTDNGNGQMTPGKTILSGKGWGMNTHIGYVGAIKNGVPIIFHNIHGQVYADPINNLQGGGRVAWVKV